MSSPVNQLLSKFFNFLSNTNHDNSDVLTGYNGTIFAYGQTGAGKSWSMMGSMSSAENKGLMPRAASALFKLIEESEDGNEFKISCSYLEIYNESIQDLFNVNNKNLKVHESPDKGIYVADLTEQYVGSEEEIYQLLEIGSNNRVVSYTQMNATSSRSHSVFIIRIEQRNSNTGTVKTGKLNLVDLAGSEKVGKTGASGQTLEEAKKINQSLSTLGQCINALVERKGHVPYRDSKLTRILQESLGGNSKTTMICACSPHPFNIEETISTLKFGQRAKSIKLSVKVNSVKSAKELQILVDKLNAQLKQLRIQNNKLLKTIQLMKEGKEVPSDLLNATANVEEGDSDSLALDNSSLDEEGSKESEGNSDPLEMAEMQLMLEQLRAKHKDELEQLNLDIEEILTDNKILEEKFAKEQDDKAALEEELEEILDENDKIAKQLEDSKNSTSFNKKELESELEEALKTIDELEKSNRDIETSLKEARDEASQKSASFTELARNISDAEARGKTIAELDRLRENNKLQRTLVSQLTGRVSSLEQNFKEEKIINVEQDSELAHMEELNKREKDKAKKELERIVKTLKELEKEKADNEEALLDFEMDINKLEAKIKASDKADKDTSELIADLKKQLADKDEQVTSMKLTLEHAGLLKKGVTDKQMKPQLREVVMNEYKNNMKVVKDKADMKEKQLNDIIKSLRTQVEEEKANAETMLNDAERQVINKTKQLEDEKKTVSELEAEVEDALLEVDKLKEEKTGLTSQIKVVKDLDESKSKDYNTSLTAHEEHIKQLEKDLEQLNIQCEQLREGGVQNASPSSTGTERTIGRNFANELMDLRNKYRKSEYDRQKFEDECNQSRRQIQSERNKLRAALQKTEIQKERISEISKELDTMRAHMSYRKDEREEFKKKREGLQAKIDELQGALEAQEKNNNMLKKKTNIVKPVQKNSILVSKEEQARSANLKKVEHKLW
jgi:kinesin family protein 5